MMRALVAYIRKEELTQAAAAKVLGVTQPRVSDLMRGKIHLFSIDNLVVLLAAAGLRVDGVKGAGRRDESRGGTHECVGRGRPGGLGDIVAA